jgi:hypothetical protein
MICNHAYQKLFSFVIARPYLLLLLPIPLHHSQETHVSLMTYTLLNCTAPTHSPILNSMSGMTLNCMFLIPVSWITHSSEPPCHSSRIAFIEDTDDMQHKVMCPALQMYLCDGPHRGPDGPVACAPVLPNLYINGLCMKAPQNGSGDPLCLLFASYSLPFSFAIASDPCTVQGM